MRNLAVLAVLATASPGTLATSVAEATEPSTPTATPTGQTWMCGREHVNYARGYRRTGMALDVSGDIWSYTIEKRPGNIKDGDEWPPAGRKRFTGADLQARYKTATVVFGTKVPASEIAKYFALIADAAKAKPTKPSQSGADRGQMIVYCYTYDARVSAYSQVMLDESGNWRSTNPSQAAKKLTSWLDGWFSRPTRGDQ